MEAKYKIYQYMNGVNASPAVVGEFIDYNQAREAVSLIPEIHLYSYEIISPDGAVLFQSGQRVKPFNSLNEDW